MADIADFANDLVQERIDRAMAMRNAAKSGTSAHSLLFCEACDDPIPEARRLASPGCSQCISCQSLSETRGIRHAR
ncbi:TraR/DksA C4-type zinc finger protein [Pseudomonas sp. C2B4]|uniref:TraR/DksA family transcriptional regulator n=1 Tax=Pseudomonas sp. C2B4 TaxID=2735270 RepID=UPI00158604AB|nr:TraR/DksA family transcriptional regulator [Pseudomonas sp. C2B4]